MTFTPKDSKEIKQYQQELLKRFPGKRIEDIRKDIVERFKDEEYPKILIVTDMLLTGFDAPILQTMYLDKPLKEHRLLQAVARTNRPFGDLKTAGLIIDYVGILREFTKAIEDYAREDVAGVLLPIENLVDEFGRAMDKVMALFKDIPKDQFDRQALFRAFEAITTDSQTTKEFCQGYRQLRRLFELLGPHPVKLERRREYTWLTQVYNFYLRLTRQEYHRVSTLAKRFFPRTLEHVYRTTELSEIEQQYPIIPFDENYLRNLEAMIETREEQAANILFTLNHFVLVDRLKSPIYETLAERVERILELWKEKNKDYERIYNSAVQIVNEIGRLRNRQEQLGFSDLQYSILLALESRLGMDEELVQQSQELATILQQFIFKNWQTQQTARKKVAREIRKYLRKLNRSWGLEKEEFDQLHERIVESVMIYG